MFIEETFSRMWFSKGPQWITEYENLYSGLNTNLLHNSPLWKIHVQVDFKFYCPSHNFTFQNKGHRRDCGFEIVS